MERMLVGWRVEMKALKSVLEKVVLLEQLLVGH